MGGTLKRPEVWTCFICAYEPPDGLAGGPPRWFLCQECLEAASRLGVYSELILISLDLASAMDFSDLDPVV